MMSTMSHSPYPLASLRLQVQHAHRPLKNKVPPLPASPPPPTTPPTPPPPSSPFSARSPPPPTKRQKRLITPQFITDIIDPSSSFDSIHSSAFSDPRLVDSELPMHANSSCPGKKHYLDYVSELFGDSAKFVPSFAEAAAQAVEEAAAIASLPPGIDYVNLFLFIHVDDDGVQWVLVEWHSDKSRTWELLQDMQDDLRAPPGPAVFEQLCELAIRDADRRKAVLRKHLAQQKYLDCHPSAVTRQQARLSRTTPPAPSLLTPSPASSLRSPLSPPTPPLAASAAPPRSFDLLCCARCIQLAPGPPRAHEASEFVCFHCINRQAEPCELVRLYGTPRARRVRVAAHGELDFVDHVQHSLSQLLVNAAIDEDAAVDIAAINYHSHGMNVQQHVDVVNSCITTDVAGAQPSIVLVLSCWLDATVQTDALRQLASQHPHILFVTFSQPSLVANDCFDAAIRQLQQYIMFSHASNPFTFIALLCELRPDCLVFASPEADDLVLHGPLRFVCRQSARKARCPCGSVFRRSSMLWRFKRKGMRRWPCDSTKKRVECCGLITF